MYAADSSSLIAFIQNNSGYDVDLLSEKLSEQQIILPPPVIPELLCDPYLPKYIEELILALPRFSISPDYWDNVAKTRAKILKHKLKSRLADAMIAQVCIDNNAPLITRDKDFRHYEKHCGLKLAI